MVELARGQSRGEYYHLQTFAQSRHPWRWISDYKYETLNTGVELGQGEAFAMAVGFYKASKRQISFRVTISRPCGGVERRALSALEQPMGLDQI
jgi:hypothetical protein